MIESDWESNHVMTLAGKRTGYLSNQSQVMAPSPQRRGSRHLPFTNTIIINQASELGVPHLIGGLHDDIEHDG